jgi:cell division septum initiation protein DivIVA
MEGGLRVMRAARSSHKGRANEMSDDSVMDRLMTATAENFDLRAERDTLQSRLAAEQDAYAKAANECEQLTQALAADPHGRDRIAFADLRTRLSAAEAEVERLKGLLHRDQTGLAAALVAAKTRARAGRWISEGRGSYEWDDDGYRKETGALVDDIVTLCEDALHASGNLANEAFHPARKAAEMENERLRGERQEFEYRFTEEIEKHLKNQDAVSALAERYRRALEGWHCLLCNGAGKVPAWRYEATGSEGETTCRTCNGDGRHPIARSALSPPVSAGRAEGAKESE